MYSRRNCDNIDAIASFYLWIRQKILVLISENVVILSRLLRANHFGKVRVFH